MRRLRSLAIPILALIAFGAVGCGGSKDKAKNQDIDRPKPVDVTK